MHIGPLMAIIWVLMSLLYLIVTKGRVISSHLPDIVAMSMHGRSEEMSIGIRKLYEVTQMDDVITWLHEVMTGVRVQLSDMCER